MKKVGFIGAGNMVKAMIKGMLKNNVMSSSIYVSGRDMEKLIELGKLLSINVSESNIELVKNCDIVFLGVKPNIYSKVIDEIKNYTDEDKVVVSITPGYSLKELEDMFGKNVKVVRTMPNTPAMVGEGVTAYCIGENISLIEEKEIKKILKCFGLVEKVEEKEMDAVVATTGSSPAYVYMFIEAMADAAVLGGISRDKAYRLAAQAVLGSAKMVLETEMHPGALKDMVCSPGGTTIEAVTTLEENGFRNAIIKAMRNCMEKSKKMNS